MMPATLLGLTATEVLLMGGLAAVVVFIIIGAVWYEKHRRETLERTAREIGLEFSPKPQGLISHSLSRLGLFGRGRARRAKNAMTGRIEDISIAIFDYRYTTGSGKNASTHTQTVAAFEIPGATLPAFEMRPEHFLHKIGGVFGYQDIDLPEFPEFSKQYLLRGANESAIRELFGREVVEFFSTRPKLSIEANGETLIVYRTRRCVKPRDISKFLEDSFEIATRLANRDMLAA